MNTKTADTIHSYANALNAEARALRDETDNSVSANIARRNAATALEDLATYVDETALDDLNLNERQTRGVLAEIVNAYLMGDGSAGAERTYVARAVRFAGLGR